MLGTAGAWSLVLPSLWKCHSGQSGAHNCARWHGAVWSQEEVQHPRHQILPPQAKGEGHQRQDSNCQYVRFALQLSPDQASKCCTLWMH